MAGDGAWPTLSSWLQKNGRCRLGYGVGYDSPNFGDNDSNDATIWTDWFFGAQPTAPVVIARPPLIRNRLVYPAGTTPGFDPTHPLAASCQMAGIASNGSFTNLLNGRVATPTGTPSFARKSIGPVGVLTAASAFRFTGVSPIVVFDVTFGAICYFTGLSSALQYIVASDAAGSAGSNISLSSTNQLGVVYTGVNRIASTFVPALDTPYLILGSRNQTTANFVVLNLLSGKIDYSATVGGGSGTPIFSDTFGTVGSSAGFTAGGVAAAFYSAKYNSLQTLLKAAQDPWSFWYPQRDTRRVVATPQKIVARAPLPLVRNKLVYPAGVAPRFDVNHPAASNIRFSAVAQQANMVNLLTGKLGAQSGATFVLKQDGLIGPGFTLNNAASQIDYASQSTVNDTQITTAWIWRPTFVGNASAFASDSSNTNGFWVGGSSAGGGRLLIQAANGGAFKQGGPSVNYLANDPLFCAISMNGTATTNMVIRNLQTGAVGSYTTTGLTLTAPNGTYRLGRAGGFHLTNSPLAAVMFAASYLSMSQLLAWAEDPWSFWYPRQKPIYVDTTTIVGGDQTIFPSRYDDPDTFYAHDVSLGGGAQTLTPSLYTDPDTFNTHVVSPGTATLTPARYDDPDTFNTHVVSPGPVTLTPARYDDPDTFNTHVVSPGTATLTPARYDDPDTFYAHTIVNVISGVLQPSLYIDPDTFYAHSITGTGTATLTPSLYPDPDTFYTHVVSPGPVILTPARYDDPDTFYAHTIVGSGAVSLAPTRYDDLPDTFYTHIVSRTGPQTLVQDTHYADPDIFYAAQLAIFYEDTEIICARYEDRRMHVSGEYRWMISPAEARNMAALREDRAMDGQPRRRDC